MSKQSAEIAGVTLTHPDRVLFMGQGITKRELAEYYEAVSEWMLPHLGGRPLTLVRCPRGADQQCFVQRRANESFPDVVRRVEVASEEGGTAVHVAVESLPGLVYMAQIGVLELHTWGARRDRLDRPDRLILDLDPNPDLPWARVVEAARDARDRLTALGLQSFVKTTGGKGLHVQVPLVRRSSWDDLREFARAVAEAMERDSPERYLTEASKQERTGKIYLDYLRNAWAASAITPYSARARPGAPVSVPLGWDELTETLQPADFTVRTVPDRLRAQGDRAWDGYLSVRQGITRGMRTELGLGR